MSSNIDPRYVSYDELRFMDKLKSPSAYYAPNTVLARGPDGQFIHPQTIHVGEKNGIPTWEEDVFDVAKYKRDLQRYRQGSINKSQLEGSPWKRTEWDEAAKEYNDIMKYGKSYVDSPFRQASGTIISTDFPAINVIQMLGDILGEDNRDYVLEQAVTRVATPNLTLSVDTWSGFTGSTDVAEGQEPFVKKGAYSRTEYMLKKQAAAIAITDEAATRYERDVFAQHVRQAAITLRRDRNQKIASKLEEAPDIGKGDWLAYAASADHRARDAARDIYDAAAVIAANGGNPNTIASHSRVFNDFVTNTAGPLAGSQNVQFSTGVVNNIPALGRFTWYIDDLKTNSLATIYDKTAVLFMEGPTKTEQWRLPGQMITRYQTTEFNSVQIVDNTRIRDITSVSA